MPAVNVVSLAVEFGGARDVFTRGHVGLEMKGDKSVVIANSDSLLTITMPDAT